MFTATITENAIKRGKMATLANLATRREPPEWLAIDSSLLTRNAIRLTIEAALIAVVNPIAAIVVTVVTVVTVVIIRLALDLKHASINTYLCQ